MLLLTIIYQLFTNFLLTSAVNLGPCYRPKTLLDCTPGTIANPSNWLYEFDKMKCRALNWQECMFQNKDECEKQCTPVKGEPSCDEPDTVSYCAPGTLWHQWFYESHKRECRPRLWEGCLFDSKVDCENKCPKKADHTLETTTKASKKLNKTKGHKGGCYSYGHSCLGGHG